MALRAWDGVVLSEKSAADVLSEQPREVLEAIILDRLREGQVHWHVKKQRARLHLDTQEKKDMPLPPAPLTAQQRKTAARRPKVAAAKGSWAHAFFRSEMDALLRAASPELEGTVLCLQLLPTTLAALELLDGCGRKHQYPYGTTAGASYAASFPEEQLADEPPHSLARLLHAPDRAVLLTCSEDGRHLSLQRLSKRGAAGMRVAYRHDGGADGAAAAAAIFVHPAMQRAAGWPEGAESLADVCWTADLLGERALSKPRGACLAGAFFTLSRQGGDLTGDFQATVRHLFYPHTDQLHALCLVGKRYGLGDDLLQRIGGAMMFSVVHRVAPSRLRRRVPHTLTDGASASSTAASSSATAHSSTAAAGPSSAAVPSSVVALCTCPSGGARAVICIPPPVLRTLLDAFATNPDYWHFLRVSIARSEPRLVPSDSEEEANTEPPPQPPYRLRIGLYCESRMSSASSDGVAKAGVLMDALACASADAPIDRAAKLPSVWLGAGTSVTPSLDLSYDACDGSVLAHHYAEGRALFSVLARVGVHEKALVDLRRGVRLEMHADRVVLAAACGQGGIVRAEAFEAPGGHWWG